MAYDSSRMRSTRRAVLASLAASALCAAQEQEQAPQLPAPPNPNEDVKLPNGKSQKDEIAKQQHQQALKDANNLVEVAEQLRDELKNSGNYVVSVSSVRKTEEIERLARRIRGRLKQ